MNTGSPISSSGRRPASLVDGEFVLTAQDFAKISAMLYADAGISLPESKATLVYSRLAKRLRALGLENFRAYCALVAGDDTARLRLSSVGRVMPGMEVQIRGEDGAVLPPNSHGEIWVRGEQVSGEYLGRNDLNAEGWFQTRDALLGETIGHNLRRNGCGPMLVGVAGRNFKHCLPDDFPDIGRHHQPNKPSAALLH